MQIFPVMLAWRDSALATESLSQQPGCSALPQLRVPLCWYFKPPGSVSSRNWAARGENGFGKLFLWEKEPGGGGKWKLWAYNSAWFGSSEPLPQDLYLTRPWGTEQRTSQISVWQTRGKMKIHFKNTFYKTIDYQVEGASRIIWSNLSWHGVDRHSNVQHWRTYHFPREIIPDCSHWEKLPSFPSRILWSNFYPLPLVSLYKKGASTFSVAIP